ncbi:VWA domain-containing protein [Phenylobacterium sp.]|uniref:VWA domain-containing protein n=1 Tax=Phenylobacterium sp. TaxID=1871053 RepID=UPI0025E79EB5|nr:VWA domain-containing protein [Phenylobacterium sp.]MBX3485119.1 VWA domain-containing protein [Phenylobacterium sp.]
MHLLIRCTIFAALIAALTQPSLLHHAGRPEPIVILDQRSSLSPSARVQAAEAARVLLNQTPGSGVLIQLGGAPLSVQTAHRTVLKEGADANSLSAALAEALNALPLGGSGEITAITDGASRDRHWDGVVEALLRRGVPVNTIALQPAPREAFIADVRLSAPGAGERLLVTVDLEGANQALSLAVHEGDRQLAVSSDFAVDGSRSVDLAVPPQTPGFHPLRIELSHAGQLADHVETVAVIQDALPVLYASGRQGGGGRFLQQLLGPGVAVRETTPAAVADLIRERRYAGLVLDDVPATRLWPVAQRQLMHTVQEDGMGLFVSGGEAAFSSGGYFGAPLASALPVTIRQDQKSEDPSVALVVVIDTSGSMLGAPLDLGKQAARLAIRTLGPADSVGVVEFYGGRQWVTPLQPARNIPEIERAISRVQAQGGSEHLFDALQEAYYGLKNTEARYKHILIISDAGVEPDRYPELIRHMAQEQVTTSTLLVGGDVAGETRMAQWARLGRGRFYSVRDEFSLVELNLKQPQEKPEPGYRRGAFPLRTTSNAPWWRDVNLGGMPPLEGYARAGERPEAQTFLRTSKGDPILASWQYGAGRVTALMTEPVGEGTRSWSAWPTYGAWLSRAVARTMDRRPGFDVQVIRYFDHLVISAQRLRATGGDAPEIRLVGLDGVATGVSAEEKAPGLFIADLSFEPSRPALVEVQADGRLERVASPAFSDIVADGPVPQSKGLPLAQLARLTGGTHLANPSEADSLILKASGELGATDLWSWLCWFALALYLTELAYRRWPSRPAFARQERVP